MSVEVTCKKLERKVSQEEEMVKECAEKLEFPSRREESFMSLTQQEVSVFKSDSSSSCLDVFVVSVLSIVLSVSFPDYLSNPLLVLTIMMTETEKTECI